MKKAVLFLFVALMISCTDPQGATRLLEDSGYTNIELTGYDFWAAKKGDLTSTGFKATSTNGRIVSGAVTATGLPGWPFTTYTIRLH